MQRRILLTALVLVSLLAASAPVAAAEDPRFETYVSDPTLAPGQTSRLTVTLVNDAEEVDDAVEPARNVKATMVAGDTPFSVPSGTLLLGTMRDGDPTAATFTVQVPENASSGTYRVPIRVTYEHDGDERDTTTVHATVRIDDRARFAVLNASTAAPVGSSGTVALTLKNVGNERAADASVTVTSGSADVRFGGSASASRYVRTWRPGEVRTVEYRASVAPGAEPREYPLSISVAYDEPDGVRRTAAPLSAGITPAPEQSFSLSNVSSTLRVGEEGRVTMTVTNEGPELARDAVVRITGTGRNVHPQETEFALGSFAAGQSATVSFPITVSDNAEAGPRQITYRISYQNGEGEPRQSDPLNARVRVAEDRDQFAVRTVENAVSAGGTATLVLEVTNNGDETVTNVNAKVFSDDPLSTADDEAFVQQLRPGESTRLTFSVSAAGGALSKTYPLSMDFQYDVDGESKLTKTYQIPVTVTTSGGGGGFPVTLVGGLVALVLLAGGAYWYTQR